MAYENPPGSFVHAAQYASLTLQVCDHPFEGKKYFDLSPDQRRILENETRALLLQARWVVDSKGFVEQFGIAQVGGQEAPPGSVLGKTVPALAPPNPAGQYA